MRSLKKYTDKGFVYHGTPDIKNVLNVIRNGLVISSDTNGRKQGMAAFGTGFYTAKDRGTGDSYAGASGIVIPLKIKESPNIRVLDVNTENGKAFYEKVKNKYTNDDPHRILADVYDIDIIVSNGSSYPLIQNAGAVIVDKDLKTLVKAAIDSAMAEIKKSADAEKLNKFMDHLLPNRGYTALMLMIDPNHSKHDGIALIKEFCQRLLEQGNQWKYAAKIWLNLKGIKEFENVVHQAKNIFDQEYQAILSKQLSDTVLSFAAKNVRSSTTAGEFDELLKLCDEENIGDLIEISKLFEFNSISEIADISRCLDGLKNPVSIDNLKAIHSILPLISTSYIKEFLPVLDGLKNRVGGEITSPVLSHQCHSVKVQYVL